MICERKTKRAYFDELRELVINTVLDSSKQDELLAFIDREVDALDHRRNAAQRRAGQKRIESDALTDFIYENLFDEFVDIDTIMDWIDDEEITRHKVASRLGKLVKEGRAEKECVYNANTRKRKMFYRKVAEDFEV